MAMKTVFAGIDVGAAELVVSVLRNGKAGKPKTFGNTPEGYAAVIKHLNPDKRRIRVCIEATGTYHLDLAVALSGAEGIEIMVMNPKAVKNFGQALMQRTKTDAVDAALLAAIAELLDHKEEFEVWQAPGEAVLELRGFARRLTELNRQKARVKNQLHALEATKLTPAAVLQSVKDDIAHLEAQSAALEKYAVETVENDEEVKQAYELLTSVKGIGKASAISILGELLVLPDGMTARQWVAHAGLDPREYSSGSSVNKKPRLTKAGNRHLRCALFMPALSAIRYSPHVNAFYRHLTDDLGKKKMQAICAVMRKLLHAVHGMLKSNRPFDGTKFYAAPANA